MPRDLKRALTILGAILLALLPLIELVDHWESFGSEPEFVSVCTILGIALALVFLIRSAMLHVVNRVRTLLLWPAEQASPFYTPVDLVQTMFPRIRSPIRV